MYEIKIKSIPIENVESRDNEVIVKGSLVKLPYGAMINRSFRIDDEMMTKILDSGESAIKVFRYIKSHTNSQSNKVTLKADNIIEYLKTYGVNCDKFQVSKGIKLLTNIKFIIKCNTLEVYKKDASNVYIVNPNYCVISSVDTVFRRIQSDERTQYDFERIRKEDEKRKEISNSAIKIKLKKSNGNIESKNQEASS